MLQRDAWLIDAEGRRYEVGDTFVIGRSRDCDLTIPSAHVQKQHLRLWRLTSDELEAEDLGTTNGTSLNGQWLRHHRVLRAGDELDVVGTRFRFELGPPVQPPPDEAVERLAEVADDEAALQVVIDELLEQGHPLGEALAVGAPQPLEPELQEAVKRQALALEWRRGFIDHARLRPGWFPERRALVRALLRSRAARLLRGLTLPWYEPRLRLEATPLRTLRQLRFGPYFRAESAERDAEALASARFEGMPRLRAPTLETYTRAWLDFGADQRRELDPGRQAEFATCVVRWDDGQWRVESGSPTREVKVNRAPVYGLSLLPGDVVQAGPLRFTFRAS